MEAHQYSKVQAAITRFHRLVAEFHSGQVQAVDYQRLHERYHDPANPDMLEDIQLERLDRRRDLGGAMMAALRSVGPAHFAAWVQHRIYDEPTEYSSRHLRRVVLAVNIAIEDALIERDLVEGYAGRDLIEAGRERRKRSEVWRNPEGKDAALYWAGVAKGERDEEE